MIRIGTMADLLRILQQGEEEARMQNIASEALSLSMFAFVSMNVEAYQRFIQQRALPAYRRIVTEVIPNDMAQQGIKVTEESRARALNYFTAIVEPMLNVTPEHAEHYIKHFEAVERGEKMPHDSDPPAERGHGKH